MHAPSVSSPTARVSERATARRRAPVQSDASDPHVRKLSGSWCAATTVCGVMAVLALAANAVEASDSPMRPSGRVALIKRVVCDAHALLLNRGIGSVASLNKWVTFERATLRTSASGVIYAGARDHRRTHPVRFGGARHVKDGHGVPTAFVSRPGTRPFAGSCPGC